MTAQADVCNDDSQRLEQLRIADAHRNPNPNVQKILRSALKTVEKFLQKLRGMQAPQVSNLYSNSDSTTS